MNKEGSNAHALGVLFVHGIGEQPKDETLLRFGEPCINWLERWMNTRNESMRLEAIEATDKLSSGVVLDCEEDHQNSQSVLMRESWWASKVSPPPINSLAWWLLLVGTWATLSHSIKPFKAKKLDMYARAVAWFRMIFYYLPIAFSFQFVILAMTLVGAIPFTPWRDLTTKALLKMSATLGDSYVFIHSPIQRQRAINKVKADLLAMLEVCDRVMIVAHSQGAAITYHALRETNLPKWRLSFISVGSGLDKLTELEYLSQELQFRGKAKSKPFRTMLYYLPLGFVYVWGRVLAYLLVGFSPPFLILVEIAVLAVILPVVLSRSRYDWATFEVPTLEWHDIFASSDPVSNGELQNAKAEDDPIINQRSLLTDHTTYFTNSISFIPILVRHMGNFGGIRWLDEIETAFKKWKRPMLERSNRKLVNFLVQWFNRLMLLAFSLSAHENLSSFTATAKSSLYSLINALPSVEIDTFYPSQGPRESLYALGLFVAIEVLTRWCDRTSERTYTNLLFCSEYSLELAGRALTLIMILAPICLWGLMWVNRAMI